MDRLVRHRTIYLVLKTIHVIFYFIKGQLLNSMEK